MGWLTNCFTTGIYSLKKSRAEHRRNKIDRKIRVTKDQIHQLQKNIQNEKNLAYNQMVANSKLQMDQSLQGNQAYIDYMALTSEEQGDFSNPTVQAFHSLQQTNSATRSEMLASYKIYIENAIDEKYQSQLDSLQQLEESYELEQKQIEEDIALYSHILESRKANKDDLKRLIPSNGN